MGQSNFSEAERAACLHIIRRYGWKVTHAGWMECKAAIGKHISRRTLGLWRDEALANPKRPHRRVVPQNAVGTEDDDQPRFDAIGEIETVSRETDEPTDEPLTLAEMEHEVQLLIGEWLQARRVDAKTAIALADRLAKLKAAGQQSGMSPEMDALWKRFVRTCQDQDPLQMFAQYVAYCETEAQRYQREGWAHWQSGAFNVFGPDVQASIDRLTAACGDRFDVAQAIGDLALTVEAMPAQEEVS